MTVNLRRWFGVLATVAFLAVAFSLARADDEPTGPRAGAGPVGGGRENVPPGQRRPPGEPRPDRRFGFPPQRGPQDREAAHWPSGDSEWLRANDAEMYKLLESDTALDRQTRELGTELRRTPKDKQDPIKKKLQDLVVEQFEARQQRRELELKRLEEELQRIREAIGQRKSARQAIIDRRVAELIGEESQF